MRKYTTGAACALLVYLSAFSVSGVAKADSFIAIEGSSLTLSDQTDNSHNLKPAGLRLRLGSAVSNLIDVEGHFGFSFEDDTESGEELQTNYYGIYVKGYLPVGAHSALFALAGMSTVNLKQTIGNRELDDSRSGASYGFGMETRLTEHADLTADYMSYIRDEGRFEEVSSFNFGIKLYF